MRMVKLENIFGGFFDHANKTIKLVGVKIDVITVQYEDITKG